MVYLLLVALGALAFSAGRGTAEVRQQILEEPGDKTRRRW